jgi:hypothetical protein
VAGANRARSVRPVARIEHRVVHDLAEEMRALHGPAARARSRLEEEETLAGADEDEKHPALPRRLLELFLEEST